MIVLPLIPATPVAPRGPVGPAAPSWPAEPVAPRSPFRPIGGTVGARETRRTGGTLLPSRSSRSLRPNGTAWAGCAPLTPTEEVGDAVLLPTRGAAIVLPPRDDLDQSVVPVHAHEGSLEALVRCHRARERGISGAASRARSAAPRSPPGTCTSPRGGRPQRPRRARIRRRPRKPLLGQARGRRRR